MLVKYANNIFIYLYINILIYWYITILINSYIN